MPETNIEIGMRCPLCGGHTIVVDTRRRRDNTLRRRRECEDCKERSTTTEILIDDLDRRIDARPLEALLSDLADLFAKHATKK